jgi:transposase
MEPRFKDCDRNTLFLMPPSVDDWVAEDHLSRFVVDIVARLDLSTIKNAYAGRGSDAYPPNIMVALLFYGYATGSRHHRFVPQAIFKRTQGIVRPDPDDCP